MVSLSPPGRLARPVVSMVLTEPPPPEPSISRMIGMRKCAAICSDIFGLPLIEASAEPPRKVKSSPATTTGLPSTMPRPNTQLPGMKSMMLPCRVVAGLAGDAADLLERSGVEQVIDAFAHRQPAAFVLARDALLAAHLARQRLALAEFGEFRFPANLDWFLRCRCCRSFCLDVLCVRGLPPFRLGSRERCCKSFRPR